jgi:hypothetical protein
MQARLIAELWLFKTSLVSQLPRAKMLRKLSPLQPRSISMRSICIFALAAFLSWIIAASFAPAYAAAPGAMSGKGDWATNLRWT